MDIKYKHFDTLLSERDLCFVDTETTGFELDKELLEIGAVVAKANTFEKIDEIDIKIKPSHIENASPEALEIVGYNEEEWEKEGVNAKKGLRMFLDFAENTILVAQNLPFDWMHIQKALEEHELQPTYHYKGLDTFSLGWLMLGDKAEFTRLSLKEMADYFKINMGTHHRAIDDARTAYEIFLKLVKTYDGKR
ncbi:3'-5' exonuclease [Patescibacteria group bacterium]|nr:3'-5' exonuclease [Patescibacteria group bacterium]